MTRNDQLNRDDRHAGRVTTLTRDVKGRLIAAADPLGHVSGRNYNAVDDVTATRDAMNYLTSRGYDNLRRLTSVTDALSNRMTLAYDAVSA